MQRVLSGHGRVANDLYGVFDACYPADLPQRAQDIEQAKALLAEAGQEGLTIDLFAPNDTAGLAGDGAAVFADQAKDAGVTVNVKVLDGGTYWGDEYLKRTFATTSGAPARTSTRSPPGSLPTRHLPGDALATGGQQLRGALHSRRWPRPTTTPAARSSARCRQQEYDEGGYIIPFFNNLLDAYTRAGQGPRRAVRTCSTSTTSAAASRTSGSTAEGAADAGAGGGDARGPAEVHSPAGRLRGADAVRRVGHRLRRSPSLPATRPRRSSAARRPRRASPPSARSSASTSRRSSSTPTGSAACSPATRATRTPTACRSWTSSATASSTRCSSWCWRRSSRSRCRSPSAPTAALRRDRPFDSASSAARSSSPAMPEFVDRHAAGRAVRDQRVARPSGHRADPAGRTTVGRPGGACPAVAR